MLGTAGRQLRGMKSTLRRSAGLGVSRGMKPGCARKLNMGRSFSTVRKGVRTGLPFRDQLSVDKIAMKPHANTLPPVTGGWSSFGKAARFIGSAIKSGAMDYTKTSRGLMNAGTDLMSGGASLWKSTWGRGSSAIGGAGMKGAMVRGMGRAGALVASPAMIGAGTGMALAGSVGTAAGGIFGGAIYGLDAAASAMPMVASGIGRGIGRGYTNALVGLDAAVGAGYGKALDVGRGIGRGYTNALVGLDAAVGAGYGKALNTGRSIGRKVWDGIRSSSGDSIAKKTIDPKLSRLLDRGDKALGKSGFVSGFGSGEASQRKMWDYVMNYSKNPKPQNLPNWRSTARKASYWVGGGLAAYGAVNDQEGDFMGKAVMGGTIAAAGRFLI